MSRKMAVRLLALLLAFCILLSLCGCNRQAVDPRDIPEYSGAPYTEINGNVPFFTSRELKMRDFEEYSELDSLGRCGAAFACIGPDTMPTEERESIANITPTGWEFMGMSNNNTYDFIENGYLYNRCHLIAHRLAGENDNERNLITGTRYMNIEGMLPFEAMVSEYVAATGGHVLYRVTPIFEKFNYVAAGVLMEAYSLDDGGEAICFCIFAYNLQPGVAINYFTGANYATHK